MLKILFLIHDLGQGGAEKVLVNLVNNMDRSKFDISVTALFGGGAKVWVYAVIPLLKGICPQFVYKIAHKRRLNQI